MSGRDARGGFTENLEAVARGVRRLEQIQDPILREAVAAAIRLRERDFRIDPASRIRMRNTVLAALAPAKPSASDRVYGVFAVLGLPAPMLVRALVVGLVIAAILGGATVASADSLPDDALYGFKIAGEQLRLAIAIGVEDRAAVELSIAEHRLNEAERLATSGRRTTPSSRPRATAARSRMPRPISRASSRPIQVLRLSSRRCRSRSR